MRQITKLALISIVVSIIFVALTPISFVPAEISIAGSFTNIGLAVALISNYTVLVIFGIGTVGMGFGYTLKFWIDGNRTTRISTPQVVVATLLLFFNVSLLALTYIWVLTSV